MEQKSVFQEALAHFHELVASDIVGLMERYQEPVLNDTMCPPPVRTTARILSAREHGVLSEQQLIRLLSIEWERLQDRYERGLRGEELYRRKTPSSRTIGACPFCDTVNALTVTSGTGRKQAECGQCEEVFDLDLLDV